MPDLPMKRLSWLFLVMLGAGSVGASTLAAAPTFPERRQREANGVTIHYSVGDEAYVDELARRLPEFRFTPPPAATGAVSLKELDEQRADYLARVAGFIGLKEPTKEMNAFYEKFLVLFRAADRLGSDSSVLPQHYMLWRRPELVARMKAGERIPGFEVGGPTGLNFKLGLSMDALAEPREFWRDHPLPISIGDGESVAADITAGLKKVQEIAAMFHTFGGEMSPFMLLHEAAEVGVVWHYIGSADRRWFCDGVANYVAWKTLEAKIGAAGARKHYDLEAELKKYGAEAASVDLERWPAAENMGKENYRENLNTANYAFATKVIAEICAKHGDGFLPKLFAEIGRTPRSKATMKTVYKAYSKLTGEDLRRYLPKPARPSRRER